MDRISRSDYQKDKSWEEEIVFLEKQDHIQLGSGLTMDKIIEKFIPIVGALFLVVGLAYLLYTSVWIHLDIMLRLGLGFFLSLAIIGSSYSFSEKLKYFADLGIGSGVLLLYSTLIYGSRTTDLATSAAIPEIPTLVTALIFTIAVTYFSSARKSKVILILGMLGAYITPFCIGQNDVWVQNISFNAYLIYFLAVNIVIYLLGSEISVRDIIPLNMLGLFGGTSTLYFLSYADGISNVTKDNFFTGEVFSAFLFLVLVFFSMFSVLVSANKFEDADDGYLAIGYLAPIVWFMFNISQLGDISDIFKGMLFALLATACFIGWHAISEEKTRLQHGALYAGGLIAAIQAFISFIPDLDVYSSILIPYAGLIFGAIFIVDPKRIERLLSYAFLTSVGAIIALIHIFEKDIDYQSLYVVISLIPAMCAFFIAKSAGRDDVQDVANKYSIFAGVVAFMFILKDLVDYIDLSFLLFYLIPFFMLIFAVFKRERKHENESTLLRLTLIWFAFGYFNVFLELLGSIYPAPRHTYIFTHLDLPTDWILVKGIFATLILFIGLFISRRLQAEQTEKRPSFLLVIFGYASLLLTGSYIIYALMNDFEIPMSHGGPRAVASTIWWTLIALDMLTIGITKGFRYHAEKLLGLILLALTVGKILLYDLSTMGMQSKIFILMIVGFAMIIFSYGVQSRGWLKEEGEQIKN